MHIMKIQFADYFYLCVRCAHTHTARDAVFVTNNTGAKQKTMPCKKVSIFILCLSPSLSRCENNE